jgi:phosphoribosyl 1,2-cyclic phosphate phosphodiesterase
VEITILGSGTSHGVPMIGCDCDVCRSHNPLNKRFRPSILVKTGEGNILVDTTPELRLQCLTYDVRRVDAVLITHTHADHIMGLDDLRRFSDLSGDEIPLYGDPEVLDDIRRIFSYIFRETQTGGGKPRISLNEIEPSFELLGLSVEPLHVMHGKLPVVAYRFEEMASAVPEGRGAVAAAYVTDVSEIPDEALRRLYGLDLLILDAVRFEPHVTHFGLYQALDVVNQVKPKRTLFTHLSHHFDHDVVNATLPDNARLAYDGQVIVFG